MGEGGSGAAYLWSGRACSRVRLNSLRACDASRQYPASRTSQEAGQDGRRRTYSSGKRSVGARMWCPFQPPAITLSGLGRPAGRVAPRNARRACTCEARNSRAGFCVARPTVLIVLHYMCVSADGSEVCIYCAELGLYHIRYNNR